MGAVDLASASQIRAARVLLGWTQQRLAEAAKVSLNALARLEQDKADSRVGTFTKIVRALEKGGIELLAPADGKGPGVRLKRPLKSAAAASRGSGRAKKRLSRRPAPGAKPS